MSKFAGAKTFQKWGFWLLSCSFLLFIAGIMAVALAFSTGEEYGCKPQAKDIAPPNVGSHDEMAKFYGTTISSGFCDSRGSGSRCGQTHNCPGPMIKFHFGYDFPLAKGTAIKAASPGTIIYIGGWGGGGGNINDGAVWVQSEDGSYATSYGHIKPANVSIGQHVDTNTVLGHIYKDHLDVKKFKLPLQNGSWACTAFDW